MRSVYLISSLIAFSVLPSVILIFGAGSFFVGIDVVNVKLLLFFLIQFLAISVIFVLYGWLFPPAPIRAAYTNMRLAQAGFASGLLMLFVNPIAASFEIGSGAGEFTFPGANSAAILAFAGSAVLWYLFDRRYIELCKVRGNWARSRPNLTI